MIDRLDATHWRVTDDDGQEIAQLLDLGADVVIHEPTDLTPARAYELGRALILWTHAKRATRRDQYRTKHGLGPEVIVLDNGTHLVPDWRTP